MNYRTQSFWAVHT